MRRDPGEVRVLVTRMFPERGIDLIRDEGFGVSVWPHERPMTEEEFLKEAKRSTALFCTLSEKIDRAFLEECSHIDVISQFGVGYDNIDVLTAERLGIPVCNTPYVLSDATADVAFGLMINVSRKMFWLHKSIAGGEWNYFRPGSGLGIELRGKTLGVFGLGRIGTEMARRCTGAFGMKVIYHNRKRNKEAEDELGARYVTFEELLEESDVLTLHASLSNETEGIFDMKAFGRMKESAIFINTARGLMHNEEDLIRAIREGVIWGAGLDVTNPEPMDPGNPLLEMENVAVLPHIGSATVETRNRMSELAASGIINYYRGETIDNIVNPRSLDRGK